MKCINQPKTSYREKWHCIRGNPIPWKRQYKWSEMTLKSCSEPYILRACVNTVIVYLLR